MTNYTTQKTWVGGELVDVNEFNTYLRDNGFYYKEQIDRLSAALPQSFSNMVLRTHLDNDKALAQVELVRADEIILRDAAGDRFREAVGGYSGKTADIAAATGAGGLDTGTEASSTWYQIYYIGGAAVTSALILHKSSTGVEDTSFATQDGTTGLRDAAARTKLAQGIQVTQTGLPQYARLRVVKTGTPTGNFWVTIEGDNAGSPDGAPIATSDKLNVAKLNGGDTAEVIFMFRGNTTSLAAATQYHIVLQADYSVSAVNFVYWYRNSGGGYASGQLKSYDGATWSALGSDAVFALSLKINPTGSTPVTLPSGYTRWAFLGWVYNNSGSDFVPFKQYDRYVTPMIQQKFGTTFSTNLPTPTLLTTYVPLAELELTVSTYINGDGGTHRYVRAAGVPDGYNRVDFANVAAAGQALVYGDDLQACLRPVLTEAQNIYMSTSATTNGADLFIEAWEWKGLPY